MSLDPVHGAGDARNDVGGISTDDLLILSGITGRATSVDIAFVVVESGAGGVGSTGDVCHGFLDGGLSSGILCSSGFGVDAIEGGVYCLLEKPERGSGG